MSSEQRDGLMAGRRGLIMGLANDKSLAWGIAKKLSEAGAELAFSYQGAAMEKRVRPLAESASHKVGPMASQVRDTLGPGRARASRPATAIRAGTPGPTADGRPPSGSA